MVRYFPTLKWKYDFELISNQLSFCSLLGLRSRKYFLNDTGSLTTVHGLNSVCSSDNIHKYKYVKRHIELEYIYPGHPDISFLSASHKPCQESHSFWVYQTQNGHRPDRPKLMWWCFPKSIWGKRERCSYLELYQISWYKQWAPHSRRPTIKQAQGLACVTRLKLQSVQPRWKVIFLTKFY